MDKLENGTPGAQSRRSFIKTSAGVLGGLALTQSPLESLAGNEPAPRTKYCRLPWRIAHVRQAIHARTVHSRAADGLLSRHDQARFRVGTDRAKRGYSPYPAGVRGLEVSAVMHGHSLVPLLRGEHPKTWRKDWLYEYFEYPQWEHVRPHRGV